MDQITIALFIFLMLVLWLVSPVGVLFFLASKILFSKKASALKRKIAWIVQDIAFLTWTSLMTVMLIIFLDSISCNILNFGSVVLDLMIISGFVFLFIMLAARAMEKKAIADSEKSEAKENNKKRKNDSEKKEINDRNKIASVKTGGSIKAKVKQKIKEDLKEIIDDEIDKRL